MGRRNIRGLELSFKPMRGSRGRGRWYKEFGGKPVYFGWGDGVTDRDSYNAALTVYRRWLSDAQARRNKPIAVGLTRRLQFDFSVEAAVARRSRPDSRPSPARLPDKMPTPPRR